MFVANVPLYPCYSPPPPPPPPSPY
jgi:hypothetical protein